MVYPNCKHRSGHRPTRAGTVYVSFITCADLEGEGKHDEQEVQVGSNVSGTDRLCCGKPSGSKLRYCGRCNRRHRSCGWDSCFYGGDPCPGGGSSCSCGRNSCSGSGESRSCGGESCSRSRESRSYGGSSCPGGRESCPCSGESCSRGGESCSRSRESCPGSRESCPGGGSGADGHGTRPGGTGGFYLGGSDR